MKVKISTSRLRDISFLIDSLKDLFEDYIDGVFFSDNYCVVVFEK